MKKNRSSSGLVILLPSWRELHGNHSYRSGKVVWEMKCGVLPLKGENRPIRRGAIAWRAEFRQLMYKSYIYVNLP